MVAHHYRSNGEPMGHVDQLFDSVNLRGMPVITELFFPLSLRYHALHHLFPSLPYHSLGTAHRRLMAELPPDSSYRETEFAGFWSVVRDLVRNAHRVSQVRRAKGATIADEWYERRTKLLDERYGRRDQVQNGERCYRYDAPEMPDESLDSDPQAPQVQTASFAGASPK
jgi:hypothetical protein